MIEGMRYTAAHGDISDELFRALLAVDRISANRLLTETTSDWPPAERIDRLVSPVLSRMGGEWEQGRASLSQIYMGALICDGIVGAIFQPQSQQSSEKRPAIAAVTLEDHHLLGKKIVSLLVRSAGFDVIDYGQGVLADSLIDKLRKDRVKILLLSTLMLRSALKVRTLVDMIHKEGLDTRVVVGGAPFLFDDTLWKDVGADATSKTASGVLPIIEGIAREMR